MKMKTWTVIANTGKQADLESGLEKKEVQKPPHTSAREFVHWLAPDSHIDDDSLRSLFKLKTSPAGARTSPSALVTNLDPPLFLMTHYAVGQAH
jgi:hypothetical protein